MVRAAPGVCCTGGCHLWQPQRHVISLSKVGAAPVQVHLYRAQCRLAGGVQMTRGSIWIAVGPVLAVQFERPVFIDHHEVTRISVYGGPVRALYAVRKDYRVWRES